MGFREPMGFAPSAVVRTAARKANKAGRRRSAVVGGVGRTSPATKKETRKMAKRRKPRSAAQKAATARMLAANRRVRKGNPTKRTKKAAAPAPAAVKKPRRRKAKARKLVAVSGKKGGSRRVTKRAGVRGYSTGAKKFVSSVRTRIAKSPRKSVTYTRYKTGKVGILFRENPAGRAKAVIAGAAGFAFGLVGADVLDRYIATMATTSGGSPLTGTSAATAIDSKASGKRLLAQAGGTTVFALGAYLLRKKSMVGTYLLGGAAVGFAAKGLQLLVTDYLMPKLLPDNAKARLGYIDGPRRLGLGGPQRPFAPSRPIGPSATGNVGAYGCTRVPVNPSHFAKSNREGCNPWPEGMVDDYIPETSVPGKDRSRSTSETSTPDKDRSRSTSETSTPDKDRSRTPREEVETDVATPEATNPAFPGTRIPTGPFIPTIPGYRMPGMQQIPRNRFSNFGIKKVVGPK